jgi:hypothetical protein
MNGDALFPTPHSGRGYCDLQARCGGRTHISAMTLQSVSHATPERKDRAARRILLKYFFRPGA